MLMLMLMLKSYRVVSLRYKTRLSEIGLIACMAI